MPERILVDSNVILDVLCADPEWAEWSDDALMACAEHARLVIDPIVFAEVSVGYKTMDGVDLPLSSDLFAREPLPWAAAFLAGKAYEQYRRRGGTKRSPLPDFYIGAHAAVAQMGLLTRDAARASTTIFAAQRMFAKKNGPQTRFGARDELHRAAATRSAIAAGR